MDKYYKTQGLLSIEIIKKWRSLGVKKVHVNVMQQNHFSPKATVMIQPRNDDAIGLDIISVDSEELCEYAVCNGEQVLYIYKD